MIKVFSTSEELNLFAASAFIQLGNQAIKQRGKFAVALAGGSTPKSLYRLLTMENFCRQIDWTKVFFFFGDERNVSPDAEESNFRMASENLLQPLQISENQIFRWRTELEDAEKIAEDYAARIKRFFALRENEFPRFDLILLGMGDDGHTASLFPLTDALQEAEKIAVSNPVKKLRANRLTLTFPVINNAANVMFLIGGESKAEALKQVLEGEYNPDNFPSQKVKPQQGNLLWLTDESAANSLAK